MNRRRYQMDSESPSPSDSDIDYESDDSWESGDSFRSSDEESTCSSASSSATSSSSSSSSSSSPRSSFKRPDRSVFEKSAEDVMRHTELIKIDSAIDKKIPWYRQEDEDRRISSMTIQHGFTFPQLQVRVSHEGSTPEMLDELIKWLLADLDRQFPLIGFDAESGKSSMRLIQLSTARRCLLIRIPLLGIVKSQRRIRLSTKFRALMSDESIFKSGAEVWTDALDVWSYCDRLPTNGCLDMSLLFTSQGKHWSLSEMCHVAAGPDSFRKDKGATCSDWDARELSMRQVIYAALDAQASYMVAAGARQKQYNMPQVLNLSKHYAVWLEKAAEWRQLERLEELESRQQIPVDYVRVIKLKKSKNGAVFLVEMQIYKSRIRLFSNVTIDWKDGSMSSWMKVVKVEGKKAFIKFLGDGDARSQTRQVNEIKGISLNRADEMDIFNEPSHRYFSDYLHGKINFNPFIQQLLQIPMSPEDKEAFHNHSWWCVGIAPRNTNYLNQATFKALNESQQRALIQTESHRICKIQGPPGTGKTRTIAAEVLRTLSRGQPNTERILLVAQTNTAARHMAESIVKAGVGPNQMQLLVSAEFKFDWHDALYQELVEGGYMCQAVEAKEMESNKKKKPTNFDAAISNPTVLVCTIGTVIAAKEVGKFQERQTLIIDEASQVWSLHALLLLRALPGIERLILFGDQAQLAPHVARQEAESVLDMAAKINPSVNPQLQRAGFSVASNMLNIQYRMNPHLGSMISTLFYGGQLESFKKNNRVSVEWVDVSGKVKREGTGLHNPSEATKSLCLLDDYQRREKYDLDDIVIICFYENQRRALIQQRPSISHRIFSVDSYQGQECKIVILTLATDTCSSFVCDKRRMNVACSRAQEKLIIVGSKDMVRKASTEHSQVLKKILAHAEGNSYSGTNSTVLENNQSSSSSGGVPSKAVSSSSSKKVSTSSSPPQEGSRLLESLITVLRESDEDSINISSLGDALNDRFGRFHHELHGTRVSLRTFVLEHHPHVFEIEGNPKVDGFYVKLQPSFESSLSNRTPRDSSRGSHRAGSSAAASKHPSRLLRALQSVLEDAGNSGVRLFSLGNELMADYQKTPSELHGSPVKLKAFIEEHSDVFKLSEFDGHKDGPLIQLRRACSEARYSDVDGALLLLQCFYDSDGIEYCLQFSNIGNEFMVRFDCAFSDLRTPSSMGVLVNKLVEAGVLDAIPGSDTNNTRIQLSPSFASIRTYSPDALKRALMREFDESSSSSSSIQLRVHDDKIVAFMDRLIPLRSSVLGSAIGDACKRLYRCSFKELAGKSLDAWLEEHDDAFEVQIGDDGCSRIITRVNPESTICQSLLKLSMASS